MELIDDADSSHAQAFKYPVKKPAVRLRFRLNTDDQ